MSSATSTARRSSSNSRQSITAGPCSRRKTSSAWRSPCPSTTYPASARLSRSGPRPASQAVASRSTASRSAVGTGPSRTPESRSWRRFASHLAVTAAARPCAAIAAERSAPEWKAAMSCASFPSPSVTDGSSPPTSVARRRSSGRRLMTTTGSHSSPPGPRSSATPSYTSGARRRLSSTSRRQIRCRASRVRRSTNSNATGFFHLSTRSSDMSSSERWVSTSRVAATASTVQPDVRRSAGRSRSTPDHRQDSGDGGG